MEDRDSNQKRDANVLYREMVLSQKATLFVHFFPKWNLRLLTDI